MVLLIASNSLSLS